MKYLILNLTLMVFALGACHMETGNSETRTKVFNEDGALNTMGCAAFVDEYQSWADRYITVMKVFKSDPANAKLAQKYSTLTRDLRTWDATWKEKTDCQADEPLVLRYKAINNKIKMEQKKLEGK